jgi:hypothetical protein
MTTTGFILLRHVNNEKTNEYWNIAYDCIRKFYPENIIYIIDDNSNASYVNDRELYKTIIIESEYPGRGELLPYYYYSRQKWFDRAVIIHDSVFMNSYIDFEQVTNYQILWDFEHHWDQIEDETRIIKLFKDQQLLHFYNAKVLWTGCFGSMCVITHDYLKSINEKYDLGLLLGDILNRHNRKSFERVIAVLLQVGRPASILLGDIHKYYSGIGEKVTFEVKEKCAHLPIIKVYTGR